MRKDIKQKLIIAISVLLIVIGIVYNFLKQNSENEISYENIIVQDIENIVSDEEVVEEKEYIKIHITGQVRTSGIIELEYGSRISDAIEKAGGLTEFASLKNVNLAYKLEDGQKLYIPTTEEDVESVLMENGENIIKETNVSEKSKVININKANEVQLEEIPGVGPSMASKIVNYRNENGEFKSIEDLKNISGIGEKKFETMREYICVKWLNKLKKIFL